MVADSLWWSVWWRWLLVWIATVVAFVTAGAIGVVHWRGRRRRLVAPPYLSFYLHDQSVMDLYQYRYRGALEQQVMTMVGRRARVSVGADLPPVRFGASAERNREEFRRYLEIAEPITVIGLLMEVLEDDVYAVDLQRLSVVPGRNVDLRRSSVRLSELGANSYVLARGVFELEAVDPTRRISTFLARYGSPEPRPTALRIRCANDGLRGDVPDGPFWARCLGTVQGWDPDAGQLVINPVAVFR